MTRRRRNGTSMFPPDVNVLDTRVVALENNVHELGSQIDNLSNGVNSAMRNMETSFTRQIEGVASTFTKNIEAVSVKIDERSKIPWPALGVMLSFLVVIGGMAYWPIQNTQSRLEMILTKHSDMFSMLPDKFVSEKELDVRLQATGQRRDEAQRLIEGRLDRVQNEVMGIQKSIVPRPEHEEKWRGADAQRTDLQRQIDELKRAFGDTFSLRDALLQMQRRIDTLEATRIRQ